MPPPDPEDDAALIERSWLDPEAFAGLYDRHAAPLHRYAARRLGASAADDIVADTFLDAFRKRHRYDRTVTDVRAFGPSAEVYNMARRGCRWVVAESAVCPVSRLLLTGDAVDRLPDHVGDGFWLGNHDHVGSLDLGDCRSGALGHGTDDVAACGLVTGGYDGP